MKKIFCIFIVSILIYSIHAQDSHAYVENQLIIWLEPGVDAYEFAANSAQSIRPKELLGEHWNVWLFEFTDEIRQRTAIQRTARMNALASNNDVRSVQNNHTNIALRITYPNDPLWIYQWAVGVIGEAWCIATGGFTASGSEIVIAVVDNGFDLNHEDIRFSSHGWNAQNQTDDIPIDYPFPPPHGTHVAGIAGAIGNNNIGITGVNWNVTILPVSISFLDRHLMEEVAVIRAYHHIYSLRRLYNETNGQSGAFIVATNSSFGIDRANAFRFRDWCEMYNKLGQVGILNVAATANANWDVDIVGDIPTTCPSPFLISVTNTTFWDTKVRWYRWLGRCCLGC